MRMSRHGLDSLGGMCTAYDAAMGMAGPDCVHAQILIRAILMLHAAALSSTPLQYIVIPKTTPLHTPWPRKPLAEHQPIILAMCRA